METEFIPTTALAQLEGSVDKTVHRIAREGPNTHPIFAAEGANVGAPLKVDLVDENGLAEFFGQAFVKAGFVVPLEVLCLELAAKGLGERVVGGV